eukprot:scaffold13273_cov35-Attheya_sp.AAC.1
MCEESNYNLQNDDEDVPPSAGQGQGSPRRRAELDFDVMPDDSIDEEWGVMETLKKKLDLDTTLSEEDKKDIQRLAIRSYHMPGNSYWQDWKQFICNNHPVLGLWWSDPRHPMTRLQRIVLLVASLSFGLAATSIVVLWYYYTQRDMSKVVLEFDAGFNIEVRITSGFLSLVSIGGILHSVFDLGVWYIQICPFCQPGGCWPWRENRRIWLWIGAHIGLEAAVIATFLALCVCVLRGIVVENDDDLGVEDYRFLLNYLMELTFSLCLFYPTIAFILFTGILGWGFIPILGGRPWEMKVLYGKNRISI